MIATAWGLPATAAVRCASASGSSKSSASRNSRCDPCASAMPRLRATDSPWLAWRITRTGAPTPSAIRADSSVDPSSTTMISSGLAVCPMAEASVSPKKTGAVVARCDDRDHRHEGVWGRHQAVLIRAPQAAAGVRTAPRRVSTPWPPRAAPARCIQARARLWHS